MYMHAESLRVCGYDVTPNDGMTFGGCIPSDGLDTNGPRPLYVVQSEDMMLYEGDADPTSGIRMVRVKFKGAPNENDELTGYLVCPLTPTGSPIKEDCTEVQARGLNVNPTPTGFPGAIETEYNTTTGQLRIFNRGGYDALMDSQIVLHGPGVLTNTHMDMEPGYDWVDAGGYVGKNVDKKKPSKFEFTAVTQEQIIYTTTCSYKVGADSVVRNSS